MRKSFLKEKERDIMRVLAIGAHFDDLELGCGGTLARHIMEGDTVLGFIATESGYADSNGVMVRDGFCASREAEQAASILGYEVLTGNFPTFGVEFEEELNKMLVKIIASRKVDTIYTHWNHDVHHDHRNLALATLHCARHVNRILMYRSNWYESDIPFQENFYVDISQTWTMKEQAIRVYRTEMERTGNLWIEYFRRQAENCGIKCGVKYAEGFQLVRWIQ